MSNGFQAGVLTHRQFEIPGLLKPIMPGAREDMCTCPRHKSPRVATEAGLPHPGDTEVSPL